MLAFNGVFYRKDLIVDSKRYRYSRLVKSPPTHPPRTGAWPNTGACSLPPLKLKSVIHAEWSCPRSGNLHPRGDLSK